MSKRLELPVIRLEHGCPVTVLVMWQGKGPRNYLVKRADGSLAVRPYRGSPQAEGASMTLYDRIFELECALDKDGVSYLDRRLILREALQAVRDEALKEGHTEGMRDALDARYAEQRAEKDAREVIPAGTGE